ncbi:MAG: type II toxin-antitoxin system VapB family antitoxin [Actinomycetes bacterium]
MRTTVNIDDGLLSEARQLAARTRRSLGDVVDDALRVLLVARHAPGRPDRVELPVFGGSGLRPGVDLEDKDGLAAVLDEGADASGATHAAG